MARGGQVALLLEHIMVIMVIEKTTTIIHPCYHVDIASQLHHTVTVLLGKLAQSGCVSHLLKYISKPVLISNCITY